MQTVTTNRPHAIPAVELARQFQAAGFVEGLPPHLPERALEIDRAACQRLKCPGCRRRGLDYRPFHHGPRYRVLACCLACGAGDER